MEAYFKVFKPKDNKKFGGVEVWQQYQQLISLEAWPYCQAQASKEWSVKGTQLVFCEPSKTSCFTFGWQASGRKKQSRRLPLGFACPDFINFLSCQASKLPNFRKCYAFTMADRQSSRFPILSCKLAFTMAEILISLTIIGTIAAITLPALQANINESSWKAQRKALYSRMSQAISMMPSLNGYGEFVAPDENGENGKDTVAMSFVTNGLGKVLELKNICDNQNLDKCSLPDKIRAVNGTIYSTKPDGTNPLTTLSQLNPKFHGSWTWTENGNVHNMSYTDGNINNFTAAGLETKNGESMIAFYNPYCVDYEAAKLSPAWPVNGFLVYPQRLMCANFIYDLNGKKGPNAIGKDIGIMTALYPTDSVVVAPISYKKKFSSMRFRTDDGIYQASKKCKSLGDYRLPTREEVMSIFYNENLLVKYDDYINAWANERYGDSAAYVMRAHDFTYFAWDMNITGGLICVKK